VLAPGYTRYWNDLGKETQLPHLTPGQRLKLTQAQQEQKQTQPPPRYSEPKLVQTLEKLGIGRPSTYATTMRILRERDYVQLNGKVLVPTALGLESDRTLTQVLPTLIDAQLTAEMEAALDRIAEGKQDWQQYLIHYWQQSFSPAIESAQKNLGIVSHTKNSISDHKNNSPKISNSILKTAQKTTATLIKTPTVNHLENHLGKAESQTCPVCKSSLEEYIYQREGEEKSLLRCSVAHNRQHQCKEVVFFKTQYGHWWNKTLGTIAHRNRSDRPTAELSDLPCPNCKQLLGKITSPKVTGGLFLKCQTCPDSVMFWSDRHQAWESPKAVSQNATSQNATSQNATSQNAASQAKIQGSKPSSRKANPAKTKRTSSRSSKKRSSPN